MMKRALVIISLLLLVMAASGQDLPEPGTTYHVELLDNGDAIWRVEHRYPLESQEEIVAFEDYVYEFQDNRTEYIEEFRGQMNSTVERAREATGRAMQASTYDVYIETEQGPTGTYGVVVYRFKWENFANTTGSRIIMGDVLPDGLFLSRDYTLVVEYPKGYEPTEVSPEPDQRKDNSLVWYGLRAFPPGEPHVVIGETGSKSLTLPMIILGGLMLAVIYYYYNRPHNRGDETDEDHVLRVIRDAGGEIYQSRIVEETGFSKSKVSQIIKTLHEEDRVQKIRKGRENLIRLK